MPRSAACAASSVGGAARELGGTGAFEEHAPNSARDRNAVRDIERTVLRPIAGNKRPENGVRPHFGHRPPSTRVRACELLRMSAEFIAAPGCTSARPAMHASGKWDRTPFPAG